MSTKRKKSVPARRHSVMDDESPLLKLLLAESTRRGETLAALAAHLGVTYERLAQWRRGESSLRTARHSVHVRAAQYLGIAPVLVLALTGVVCIDDFILPEAESLEVRLKMEMNALLHDPFVAAFAPKSLNAAAPEVKLFVVWLYRELRAGPAAEQHVQRWVTDLQRVVSGVHKSGDDGRKGHLPGDVSRPRGLF